MKKLFLLPFIFFLALFGVSPAVAAEPPYQKIHSNIFENISPPQFLDNLAVENPMYVFSNPFRENAIFTPEKIQEVHSLLPQTKVILHLLCCTMFDNKEVDSIPGKIHADLQNTQSEFNGAWANHRDAFMKNDSGGYVYYQIQPTGQYWFLEGDGYLMDPENSFYQEFIYNKIKSYITTEGYDGIYLDLMYPRFMTSFYYSVPATNGNLHEVWRSKLISFSRAIQNKRQNDPDPKMKNALIVTNSVGGGPGDSNDPIDRIQFNRDLQTQGVQIENPFMNYRSMSTANWVGTVNRIRDITALRNNQMRGWLNYHAGDYTYTNEQECNNHGLFAYSSYLLGNQSPLFGFFFECLMGPGIRKEPSQNLTHIRLGLALNPYQALSSDIYLREFEKGFALVNPTSGQRAYQAAIALKNAYSSATYQPNSTITLAAHSGMVLLKDTSAPTQNPADLTDEDDTPGDQVNEADYNVLLSDFGKTGNPGWINADINDDGTVDEADYNELLGRWGE